jgi:septal ring factor EnvC (AmiA/AmiB activator)
MNTMAQAKQTFTHTLQALNQNAHQTDRKLAQVLQHLNQSIVDTKQNATNVSEQIVTHFDHIIQQAKQQRSELISQVSLISRFLTCISLLLVCLFIFWGNFVFQLQLQADRQLTAVQQKSDTVRAQHSSLRSTISLIDQAIAAEQHNTEHTHADNFDSSFVIVVFILSHMVWLSCTCCFHQR